MKNRNNVKSVMTLSATFALAVMPMGFAFPAITATNGVQTSNEAQGDFSEKPSPEKDIIIHTCSRDIKIPLPKGFCPQTEDPQNKLMDAEINADVGTNTVSYWFKQKDDTSANKLEAAVIIPPGLAGKSINLSAFAKFREEVRKNMAEAMKNSKPRFDKLLKKVATEANKESGTNIKPTSNLNLLSPHFDEKDRIGYTLVIDLKDKDERELLNWSIISSATIWIRGTVAVLSVSQNIENEEEIDATIASTRKVLAQWIIDVDTANDRQPLAIEDMIASADALHQDDMKKKMTSDKQPEFKKQDIQEILQQAKRDAMQKVELLERLKKKPPPKWYSLFGRRRVIVYAILALIGGIFWIIKHIYKFFSSNSKKKDNDDDGT